MTNDERREQQAARIEALMRDHHIREQWLDIEERLKYLLLYAYTLGEQNGIREAGHGILDKIRSIK